MRVRCGGIFNDRFTANFQEIVTVKEFRKSDSIWWSFFYMFRGPFFSGHGVYAYAYIAIIKSNQILLKAEGPDCH